MPSSNDEFDLALCDELGVARLKLRLWLVRQNANFRTPINSVGSSPADPFLVEGSTYGYELCDLAGVEPSVANLEPSEVFEPDKQGALRGRASPGNRAGTLVVAAFGLNGERFAAAIEVVSAKLRYDFEYRWMLRDITAVLAEAALSRFGATQSPYVPVDHGKPQTLYQRFAFVQAILESDEYKQALQQILALPYVAWEPSATMRSASRGLPRTQLTLRALASVGPRRRLHEPIGPVGSVPRTMPEQTLRPTTDNFPNQYVRAVLEDWRGLAQRVYDSLALEQSRTRKIVAPVARGLRESLRLVNELDAVLATPLLRSTSRCRRQAGANEVLRNRAGYREIVRINLQSQLAAALTWNGSDLVFGAGQRDVGTLYEYWVFLQLGRIVAEICGQTFDFAGLFSASETGLQLNLRKGRTEVVKGAMNVNGIELEVGLWFNRSFRRSSGESWSRAMRPDFSLSFGLAESFGKEDRVWLHFDAKYRLESLLEIFGDEKDDVLQSEQTTELSAENALREDLLKMHAYRDAIRRSSGAYVIYPGDGSGKADETFLEYHELLPGLGAFALRPSEHGQAKGDSGIRRFIYDTLAHVTDVLNSERRAYYWLHQAMGDPPHPPRIEPTPPQNVRGLWFLERPPADEIVLVTAEKADIRWVPETHLLMFQINRLPNLTAQLLRGRWIILLTRDSKAILLELEDNIRVEAATPGTDVGPGIWWGVRATARLLLPDWLTPKDLETLMADSDAISLSWARLAVRIAGMKQ